MTEPPAQFEGEWPSGGRAVIDVGLLPTASGTNKVSISSEEGWPEMLLTPREAVKLANALLTIAAPEARTARQVKASSWTFGGDDQPAPTIWRLDAEL